MLQQLMRWSIKTNIIFLTAAFFAIMVHGTLYSQILADTANYQIDIGDVYTVPGQIIEIPIQIKNLNPLGAFFIRFTYDSTVIRPLHLAAQPDQNDLDYFRNSMNFDSPDVIYDSLILTDRGLVTLYIDSSGLYCSPYYDVETNSNVIAFHNPNDDSLHVGAVFISFIPSMPPFDQCRLDYYDDPIIPPKDDTVGIIAYVLFQVEWNVIPGTISDVSVGNYRPLSPEDPAPDYRDNQFSDTDGIPYIFPTEGMGFGQIHILDDTPYCGNIDGKAGINILDVVFLINYKYKSGPAPNPLSLADVDGVNPVNILDVVHLINFIYKDGPNPACP